jgi:hypothetical protein
MTTFQIFEVSLLNSGPYFKGNLGVHGPFILVRYFIALPRPPLYTLQVPRPLSPDLPNGWSRVFCLQEEFSILVTMNLLWGFCTEIVKPWTPMKYRPESIPKKQLNI